MTKKSDPTVTAECQHSSRNKNNSSVRFDIGADENQAIGSDTASLVITAAADASLPPSFEPGAVYEISFKKVAGHQVKEDGNKASK